jgi:FG-GAP-like repeat
MMNPRSRTSAALGWSTLLLTLTSITVAAQGDDKASPISWKKTVIEGAFRSEGVAVADVNKDGKLDVLIGDSWYEAPSWTKHDIRKPGSYGDGLRSYSDCMTCWTDDVNGDGWADQIVIGFPGRAAFWYENPQGKPGYWPSHEIWHSANNETPLYTDLLGDGHRVLVMAWQPKGKDKDKEGTMAWFAPGGDPNQLWEMHAISELGGPNKQGIPGTQVFSHGLGAGDLNGDGRADVICTGGWWEQPESARNSHATWAFHPANLGEAAADMIAYDVTGDGKADVIDSSAHKLGIWWFEQGEKKDGSPVFTRHDLFPDLVSETHALIAADIDGDGLKDLITGKRFWSHGRSEPGSDKPAKLYWLQASRAADGKTAFTPREIDDQSGIGTQFTVTDFNGDGLLDIVTSNKKGVFLFEQSRPSK